MPADERRAALIAATEPLLEHFGRDVSTKRIAEAAGVAEGTIFRVFPTKEALIDAVCDQVFDLDRTCAELARIDLDLQLDARLMAAVTVMQRRLRRIFALFHALRMDRRKAFDPEGVRARQRSDNERLTWALEVLLTPDAAALRMPVSQAANSLRLMTLAFTHPMLSDPQPHQPREIVDLVLHGITRDAITRPPAPYDREGPTAC